MATQDKIQMMKDAGMRRMGLRLWQNVNGTWSHHRDAACQWAEKGTCETDLRFSEEWAA